MFMNNETGLHIEYGPQASKIEVVGPLTDVMALQFDRMLTVLRVYYGYQDIKLVIHSPGGQLLALQHMLAAMDRWRAMGGRVSTHATMETGSAAALLLAMGEVGQRSAQPHTQLLFHHTRVKQSSDSNLTAAGASSTANRLLHLDRTLIECVAKHLNAASGGAVNFGQKGLTRCGVLHGRFNESSEELGLHPLRREPDWLKETTQAFAKVAHQDKLDAYIQLLGRRFGRDEIMDLREAWVLQLIDAVVGISVLSPERDPVFEAAAVAVVALER